MLRISSGLLRGIPLRSPTGEQTRPTSERLRQSIFNVLRNRGLFESEDPATPLIVLDLFAGTGALGLEAVSNGARAAVLVESHPLALKALEANVEAVARSYAKQSLAEPRLTVVRQDIERAFARLPVARLMLCDPPYGQGWLEKVIALEDAHGRLEPNGVLVFECSSDEASAPGVLPAGASLQSLETKIYGDSAVRFFVKTR